MLLTTTADSIALVTTMVTIAAFGFRFKSFCVSYTLADIAATLAPTIIAG